jgi:hypothetical protein
VLAIDILARAEGRKSSEQQIKKTKQESFESSMTVAPAGTVNFVRLYQQELRFDDDGCSSIGVPYAGQQEIVIAKKEVQQARAENNAVECLTVAAFQELSSHTQTQLREALTKAAQVARQQQLCVTSHCNECSD